MPENAFRPRSKSVSFAERNDRLRRPKLDTKLKSKTDDDIFGSTYIPNRFLTSSSFWNSNDWSPLMGRGISLANPEYFNLSVLKMIQIALNMSSGAEIIMSFGARDGGFDFAERLREDLYAALFGHRPEKNRVRAYLDYHSLQEHPATRYPWHAGAKKGFMENPFWDIAYRNGVENAKIMIFNISSEWLRSAYCYEEFEWFREKKKKDVSFPGLFLFNKEAQEFLTAKGQDIPGLAKIDNGPKLYNEIISTLSLPNISSLNVGLPMGTITRIAKPGPLDERGATGAAIPIPETNRYLVSDEDKMRIIDSVRALLDNTKQGD